MKNPEEPYCREAFEKYLSTIEKIESIQWRKSETPDYFFIINGDEYAVEVTIIMNNLRPEGVNAPIAATYASIDELNSTLENNAVELGLLDGVYIISINKPLQNFRKMFPSIEKEAREYIQKNQGKKSASKEFIFQSGSVSITIHKTHNSKSYISTVGPVITRWAGESRTELKDLLAERISSKKKKLRNINLKKILLLYDGYHFSDHSRYIQCAREIADSNEFQLIYLVQQKLKGAPIFGESAFEKDLSIKS